MAAVNESDESSAMVRATCRITRAQEAAMQAEVDAGRFPNLSEAIRHALTSTYLGGVGASQKKAREGDNA